MSRRPASDVAVPINIDGVMFRLATSTLTHLPDAVAFIRSQTSKGVSPGVAAEYARLAAKLFREGRAQEPERLAVPGQRTAINAYWAWAEAAYELRIQAVLRVFVDSDLRQGIRWLRVHSIVPPFPGKTIPRMTKLPTLRLDSDTKMAVMTDAEITQVPTDAWTLHVPRQVCAAHQDPCGDCVPIELDAERLEAVAVAFELAWGHRDPTKVPAGCCLFGVPPRESAPAARVLPLDGRVVALVQDGVLAETVLQLRGSAPRAPQAFIQHLAEGAPDVVVISRAAAGDSWREVLAAVERAWAM